jgi:hypothetical protein
VLDFEPNDFGQGQAGALLLKIKPRYRSQRRTQAQLGQPDTRVKDNDHCQADLEDAAYTAGSVKSFSQVESRGFRIRLL